MANFKMYGDFNNYNSFTSDFDHGYRQNKTYRSDALRDHYIRQLQSEQSSPKVEIPENRSLLNRTIDALMLPIYSTAGFMDGVVDNKTNEDGSVDKGRTPLQGLWQGVKASNPFGEGYIKGETTYSDVLGSAGWNPESTSGKILKGTVGFGLDVVLDPTTYLTGGGSALIKGTGRSGKALEALGKASDNVAEATQFNKRYDELIAQGVEEGIAKKRAEASLKAFGVSKATDTATHMSDEMAQEIIKYQTRKRGVSRSADEIAIDATKLADEYNRVIGIRDARGAGDVTWGIGNMPFAPKSWQDKTIRLGSQEALQKVSDKLKISTAYQGLRSQIYGRQIGKMFSTTSPLWKLAQDNPSKLWEGMEYIAHTRGMKMDKLQEEKAIRDYFKSMNFTPAENKEILELLQDKTVWHKVAEKAKFKDLEKVKEIRTAMKTRSSENQQRLDELVKQREMATTMKQAMDEGLIQEKELLDVVNQSYQNDLASLDMRSVQKQEDLDKLIKMYSDEIDEIEKRSDGDIGALERLYEESLNERGDMNKHMGREIELPDSKIKMTREEREHHALGEVLKKANTSPGREYTFELRKALGSHVFGNEKILTSATDDGLDQLMKFVREGKDVSDIRRYVEANPMTFNPTIREMNSFVAQELGYKAWHGDGFREPLAKLLGEDPKRPTRELREEAIKLYQSGKMKDYQKKQFEELMELEYKRTQMQRFLYRMSPEEFTKFRTEKANEQLIGDYHINEDGLLDFKRQMFREDQSATNDEWRGVDMRHKADIHGDYKPARTMSDGDKAMAMNDLATSGIFKQEVVENADGKFLDFLNRIVSELDEITINRMGKSYVELSPKQKTLALRMAKEAVEKGRHGHDAKVVKKAFEEKKKRLEREVEELRQVEVPHQARTPREILENTHLIQYDLVIKKGLVDELTRVQDELHQFTGQINKEREDIVNFYNERIVDHETKIMKLEKSGKSYDRMLREASDENLTKLKGEIDEYEDMLAKDDALETWMRSHSQADVELIKNPTRYSSRIRMVDDMGKHGMPDSVMGWTNESGMIYLNKARYDNLSPKDAYRALKNFEKELKDKGITGERVNKILNTSDKVKKTQQFVKEHELSHVKNKDWEKAQKAGVDAGDYSEPIVREYEVRANMDALDMVENFDVDKMLREATPVDAGKIWLDSRASSDKVAETVRILRNRFVEMGAKEVDAGKLTEEQFQGLLMDYVPHILTPEGRDYFRTLNEIQEHGSKITHDLGYGLAYSPHSRSRSIKGKTIEQINKQFETALKGKNLFSENVADIYLARAMNHVELMYDDRYMRNMMNVFGKDIPADGAIEEGYKAVMNYGMMKRTTNDITGMKISNLISHDVSDFLSANFQQFKAFAVQSGKDVDEFISQQVDQYLKKKYSDEQMAKIWEDMHEGTMEHTGMPSLVNNVEATPMIELDAKQVESIRAHWNSVYDEHLKTLNKSMNNAMKRGDMKRVEEVQKRFEKLAKRTQPQIKQVNDMIVQKANQARMLQRAKDQSKFLQIYDKFLHFMKLNQTVVAPSFHMRNKASNVFLNWLGTGRDAVNKDFQIATTVLSRIEGDPAKLKEIIDNGKFGSEQLGKPINITEPHASLVEAIGLNNGQLHWNDVYELAVRYNVIDVNQFAQDIGAGAQTKGLAKGKLARETKDGKRINLDPTDTENFALYKAGTKVGSTIENSDRILHFVSQLRQGKSLEEASELSKKFLFDYGDLTAFEKHTMKRIFPYYTWLRKNARLQVSQVIDNPGKYRDVAKAITGIQHMTPEDERMNSAFVSDWAEGWLQMPWSVETEPAKYDQYGNLVSDAKTEPVLLNPAMPFMDLNRIPDPTKPLESLRELFSQTAPQIKNPIELASNTSSFFNDEIVKEGENPIVEGAKHLGGQFALGNIASGFFGRDTGADVGLHALNSLTGVKMNSYDYETSKKMKLDEMNSGEKDVDGHIQNAIRNALGGAKDVTKRAGANLVEGLLGGVESLVGQEPLRPEEYSGALRPLSTESYNRLSESEKQKYAPPTKDVAMAYNQEALRMSQEAFEKTGKVSRFVWSLLDKFENKDNTDLQVGYVQQVKDGDTLRVKVGNSEKNVRLLLVDTPESVGKYKDDPMPFGKDASNYTKGKTLNKDVKLHIVPEVDEYGRTLAYIELEDGTDLNKDLIEEGMGRVRYTHDNYPNTNSTYGRTDEYFGAQNQASQSEKGVWSIPNYAGDPNQDEGYLKYTTSDIQGYLNRRFNK